MKAPRIARRIVAVSAKLLTDWDYKKGTVEEIANRAGICKGTVYLHWKTKEGCSALY